MCYRFLCYCFSIVIYAYISFFYCIFATYLRHDLINDNVLRKYTYIYE